MEQTEETTAKKKYKKDGPYCCVTGCHSRRGREKVGFFKVKRASKERTEAWAKAINRKNKSGGLWMPTKNTLICGKHFLGDGPSDDSGSPDFIPSQWPEPNLPSLGKKPKTQKDFKRFERVSNRKADADERRASNQVIIKLTL